MVLDRERLRALNSENGVRHRDCAVDIYRGGAVLQNEDGPRVKRQVVFEDLLLDVGPQAEVGAGEESEREEGKRGCRRRSRDYACQSFHAIFASFDSASAARVPPSVLEVSRYASCSASAGSAAFNFA